MCWRKVVNRFAEIHWKDYWKSSIRPLNIRWDDVDPRNLLLLFAATHADSSKRDDTLTSHRPLTQNNAAIFRTWTLSQTQYRLGTPSSPTMRMGITLNYHAQCNHLQIHWPVHPWIAARLYFRRCRWQMGTWREPRRSTRQHICQQRTGIAPAHSCTLISIHN